MRDPIRTVARSGPEQNLRGLSSERQRLVDMMQRINFGRIESLVVRDGQPELDDPAPRVVHELKFGGVNGPRPEAAADFAIKAQVVELLEHFDRMRNGRIEVLTVKHGVPFGMDVEAAA